MFSEKYVFSKMLAVDYVEHLTDIEMRKDKRRTDDWKRVERKQQESNDIDWEDLSKKPVVIP